MTRLSRIGIWCLTVAGISILVASAAHAADTPEAAGKAQYKSVSSEVAVQGLTKAEKRAEMARVHAIVTSEMPEGTLTNRIGVRLTENERRDLRDVVPTAGEPLKIGIAKALPAALSVNGILPTGANARVAGGSYTELPDGGFSWAIGVGSEDAHAIRVHVSNASLPENTEMFIFDMDGEVHGPYTGAGPQGTGEFWTNSVRSDTAVIMVRHLGPATDRERAGIRFKIDKVGHIGRGPVANPQNHSWNDPAKCAEYGDNPPCVEDASCHPESSHQSAIAKMEWIAGCCIYTCTGGLIADTAPGQRNLFLTANHCLSRQRLANSLEFWFDYTTSSCRGACPHDPPDITNGATLLDSSTNGDHTLLELNSNPPSGSTFLGWSNAPVANSNGTALHRFSNPNYGAQVYSEQSVDTGAGTCSGLPRGEFIYSNDDLGATDGGSSGSPVVNSSDQIVGQLYGACGYNVGDPCDSASNSTVDGALAHYWPDVAQYLDPTGCSPVPEVCNNGTDDDCDGDVDCADADCSGDPACVTCSVNGDCDDGQFCNGAETCVGGSCQNGSDPCPGQGCDEANDVCVSCGGNKAPCSSNADCCSNNCKNGSCKGN